ncbi:helix-turn-helix domain-containing protein [Tenacibaculum sp. 190524A05c]|uniref:helix-turn-helix domain-containing protein n=1 Tax=Tenacibaculum platacis TaxID=3137852 RepID=UPI0031FB32F2
MNAQVLKQQLMALAIYDANDTSLTVEECAAFLGKSYVTIIRWIDQKKIVAVHNKSSYSIPKIQFLDKIIEKFKEESEKETTEFIVELDIEGQVKKALKNIFKEAV